MSLFGFGIKVITHPIIQYGASCLSWRNNIREGNERDANRYKNEKLKLLELRYIILFIKVPEDSTGELLGLIKTFIKEAGYKTNIQLSVVFLYIKNKYTKKK